MKRIELNLFAIQLKEHLRMFRLIRLLKMKRNPLLMLSLRYVKLLRLMTLKRLNLKLNQ